MNVLFFLTPKSEVAHIYTDFTVRQALEKMEYHQYTAIPLLGRDGRYVGTVTEGDFLWAMKERILNGEPEELEELPVTVLRLRHSNEPISISADIEDLILKAMNQNFVPVVDDKEIFIGIVTRKDIIQYCYRSYLKVKDGEQA